MVQQVRLKASELERSQCAWMKNHLGHILLEGHSDMEELEPRDHKELDCLKRLSPASVWLPYCVQGEVTTCN